MTTEELIRDTLHGRAALIRDGAVPARSSAAQAQARVIRSRRRAAIVAVAALAVVGGAAMVRVSSEDRADGPDPADVGDLGDRVLSVRQSFAGRTLIDSAETTGGAELSLRAGSARGTQWLLACSGVGSEYSLHVSVDGREQPPALCDPMAGLGDTSWFMVPPAGAGFESDLRLWVTGTGDAEPVDPADAVLGAAAYALPEPYATLGGHDVYPIEENFGAEWQVLTFAESEAGERSVTLEVPAQEGATMLDLLSSGTGEATVRLAVDGRRVRTVPDVYVLGGRSLGDMLTGGEAHRVTLWIPEDEIPPDALLAVVVRERVR
ncbi:hypothetical protein [uncultured Nocardioides sp.]|uniref:hypothetical protein n=1 Tax=uncultured Nocardioides sp. TaxID=198441 RepID=UPI00261115E3|nr:hypothetical protein [uncultured Nocardioides sp.]